jgi:hypothetical protein
MSNIIPFEGSSLPSYLSKINVAALNSDITAHAGGGFPVISIKGKVFSVVRDGDRKVLPNPRDPDSPATAIDVVILKANKNPSKVFYAKGYSEGSDGVKPDCFSNNGTHPDASVESPQSKVCATCKWNQWGSKIGDTGSKGKACQDSVRIAIATPNQLRDPYMLRVPPASIRSLGEYGKMIANRNVLYNAVVTKIAFDMEAPTPKLTFKPVGLIDEESYRTVQEMVDSEVVSQILGQSTQSAPVVAPEVEPEPVVVAKVEEAPKEVAKPKATKKAADVDVDVSNIDLNDLNFDD